MQGQEGKAARNRPRQTQGYQDMKRLSLLMLALAGATSAAAEDLRIGTSADYPPWESVDAANEIIGFDRDFGDELCKRIGAECSWVNQAYDGLLPGLQVGKFDAVISGISINEERAKMVDFTVAYADAPSAFAGPAASELTPELTKDQLVAGLSGKTIGVQTGTTFEQVLRAHLPDVTVRTYDRPEQIVDDISAERIDAGLMELAAWQPFVSGESKDELKFFGAPLTGADYPEFGEGQGVALKKGNAELQKRMDEAITAMLSDGTLEAISTKWFGYDLSVKR